ncbi:MAG TPA: hypothetical protein VFL30_03830 [Rhodanobacteraceae bacterium]|nr:hypothetical protein [Rhodanobacteraceae bacterium]
MTTAMPVLWRKARAAFRTARLLTLGSLVVLPIMIAHAAVAGDWMPLFDPYVEPVHAMQADPIVYFVWWNGCGHLRDPTITQSGNVIEIRQQIEAICGVPIGGGLIHYELGRFPPGDYVVHMVPCEYLAATVCLPGSSPLDVNFTVAAIAARPLPALGAFASAVFAVSALLSGILAFRTKRHGT